MKKLLITFGTLIILTSCGYSSEDECRLKEMQKCDSGNCENQAYLYCSDEFRGDSWLSILMEWVWTIGWWVVIVWTIIFFGALTFGAFTSEVEDRGISRWILLGYIAFFLVIVLINR